MSPATPVNIKKILAEIFILVAKKILKVRLRIIDQVCHEVSATRSRTLFNVIFWLEDHFGLHKNFGSWGVSAAFAKYEQMFNSEGKHKFSVLRN